LLPTKRDLEPVNTTSEEFENGDFTPKAFQLARLAQKQLGLSIGQKQIGLSQNNINSSLAAIQRPCH